MVAPRDDADGRRCYLLVRNPLDLRASATLTAAEVEMLVLAARGCPGKVVAHSLGVSQSHVSASLARAAHKLGMESRTELVRVAASLANRDVAAPSTALTSAERDVLELLVRGLSNAQIAALRGRAVGTVAKQVSSILAKTNSPGRRALARVPLDPR